MSRQPPHLRLKAFDDALRGKYGPILVGCDDSGRGSWAGPLAVGAVILPVDCELPGLNDSKKMSREARDELAAKIKELALAWNVCFIAADEIDAKSITWANTVAMKRACEACTAAVEKPADYYIVDNTTRFPLRPALVIPKGDGTSLSVAAASVLAKTERDALMVELSKKYPQYGWDESKGYVNEAHVAAVKLHGLVDGIHRKSYKIVGINRPQQITLTDL